MSTRGVCLGLVLLLVALPGCHDRAVGPLISGDYPPTLGIEVVPVALDTLELGGLEVPGPLSSGAIIVIGHAETTWSADRTYWRARIHVHTSAGDEEHVLMGPMLCKTDTHYTCFDFIVNTYNSGRIADLQERVEAMPGGARWKLPQLCPRPEGDCFGVTPSIPTLIVDIFGNDLGDAMRIAAEWPELIEIHPNWIATLWDPTTRPTSYRGGLPLVVGSPTAGNGVLEVAPGDTVTVEYTTPDGAVLRDWRVAVF